MSGNQNDVAVGEAEEPVIAGEGITVRFGGVTALRNVSISVPRASVVGLIGPNGAGKSTLLGVLSGLITPQQGRVYLCGEEVTSVPTYRRTLRGLSRTFQHPELFSGMCVREHLTVAWRARYDRSRSWRDFVLAGAWRRPPQQEDERVDSLMAALGIEDLANAAVSGMPLGRSRLVEIARALACSPKVVLLDEPLSGLNAAESEHLAETIHRLVQTEKVSFLLIDHDVDTVLARSANVVVLDFGEVIATGTPRQVWENPAVRAAYLGGETVVAGNENAL